MLESRYKKLGGVIMSMRAIQEQYVQWSAQWPLSPEDSNPHYVQVACRIVEALFRDPKKHDGQMISMQDSTALALDQQGMHIEEGLSHQMMSVRYDESIFNYAGVNAEYRRECPSLNGNDRPNHFVYQASRRCYLYFTEVAPNPQRAQDSGALSRLHVWTEELKSRFSSLRMDPCARLHAIALHACLEAYLCKPRAIPIAQEISAIRDGDLLQGLVFTDEATALAALADTLKEVPQDSTQAYLTSNIMCFYMYGIYMPMNEMVTIRHFKLLIVQKLVDEQVIDPCHWLACLESMEIIISGVKQPNSARLKTMGITSISTSYTVFYVPYTLVKHDGRTMSRSFFGTPPVRALSTQHTMALE